MPVKRLDHVHYWTRDMDEAIVFYRDVLGLVLLRRDGSNWAEFDGGTVRFALHGVTEGWRATSGGATAVFEVDDLDEDRKALEEKGVRFHEQVGDVPGYARFATFDDPDGNTVQIIEYVRHG